MNESLLKKRLMSRIRDLENDALFAEMLGLLEDESGETLALNASQVHAVEEAREEYKRGEFLTDSAARALFETWLRSK
jgi:hypothetical protein